MLQFIVERITSHSVSSRPTISLIDKKKIKVWVRVRGKVVQTQVEAQEKKEKTGNKNGREVNLL